MSNHNIAPQPVPSSPQQYQPQQPQPQPPQPQHLHTTICGIAAVVFGALGLVLSFIPIVNNTPQSLASSASYWRLSP